MRTHIILAAVAALTFATAAQADVNVGEKQNGFSVADEQYLVTYAKAHDAGFDVGRNLLESAWSDDPPVSEDRIAASRATLERWLNPPPAPEPVVTTDYSVTTQTNPAAPLDYAAGAGGSTVQCESGGDYSANTGNGYYGGWQFDSSTWDAYGDPAYGEANEAPPAVQDAAAASVPYDAWPNC